MTSKPILMTAVALALMSSACAIVRSGPDENRAEVFEFTPSPAGLQETVEAFRDVIGPVGPDEGVLDEATVEPIGKYSTPGGSIYFADFQMVGNDGRSQCGGTAGPGGGSWGCGPIGGGQAEEPPSRPAVVISGTGSTGTWSDVHLHVSADVSFLTALAEDGTTYRMEPIGGNAWMEWKTAHGDVTITAFDDDGQPLESISTDAG